MSKVTVIREVKGWKGAAVLVEVNGKHYVVSSVDAMFSGPETLAFEASPDGAVENYREVAGGCGMSREETFAELEGDDADAR